jgi:hypothetical protein
VLQLTCSLANIRVHRLAEVISHAHRRLEIPSFNDSAPHFLSTKWLCGEKVILATLRGIEARWDIRWPNHDIAFSKDKSLGHI